MNTSKTTWLIALFLALQLSVGACFGNSDAQESPEQAEDATSQPAPAADELSPEAKSPSLADDAEGKTEEEADAAEAHSAELPKPILPLSNDAVILGILILMLGFVFWSSTSEFILFRLFYKVIPMLLMCYFLPSLLTLFGIVDAHESNLYFVASRYLLPASLVLLTLSIDLREVLRLGPKAVVMFLAGTVGVVLGGPLAVLIVSIVAPDVIGVDGPAAVWRGLSTVAGSWIGGGANQAAMQVVFMTPPDGASEDLRKELTDLFSVMVAVDVFVAEIWMIFLLLGVGKASAIDRFFKADSSSIERLKDKMESFSKSVARMPSAGDLMVIAAIGFGATALAHFCGDLISQQVEGLIERTAVASTEQADTGSGETSPELLSPYGFLKDLGLASSFFWLIVISTTIGVALSFTRLRNYEGAGASRLGTVFIFILVAVIGMGMDVRAVVENPGYFLVGGIWMAIHVGLMFLVGWLIRAPYFFLAVGSKANIGGAASAPVVAAAFHPSLAPVGVLLAVLGYALGTYGAMLCAWLMRFATPSGL